MTVEDYHDFFVAGSSVAGALIGLLFVAISVSQQRLAADGQGAVHRVRASAALAAFSNALVVSLFGLVPGENLGGVAAGVSCVGLVSVVAILLALVRGHALRLRRLRDLSFLVGLTVVFVVQLTTGLTRGGSTGGTGLQTLATLIVVCFLIGVTRAWELIGGPSVGIAHEVQGLAQDLVTNRGHKSPEDHRADAS